MGSTMGGLRAKGHGSGTPCKGSRELKRNKDLLVDCMQEELQRAMSFLEAVHHFAWL